MIKSPCVNVCKIDYERGYCIGCNRTIEEITNWSSFNDSQKKIQQIEIYKGANYTKKFKPSAYGPFNMGLNYKHTGKFIDFDGSKNSRQKSTNLVDLSIKKNWFDNIISINLTNLLNERYEKPATYSQDGRELKFGFRKTY